MGEVFYRLNTINDPSQLRFWGDQCLANFQELVGTRLVSLAVTGYHSTCLETPNRKQIGSYLVERMLGRGGMGVVYLALDPRLKRRVAIKALPERYAADPEWRARFTQEAEALGRLNHPHIGLIYERLDIEGEGSYLILEYIEGQSLRQVIRGGSLQINDALDLSAQVASALEAAHHRGIIHRDIKPENIQVTDECSAKVLDFGLAVISPSTCAEASGDTTIRVSPLSTAEWPRGPGTPGYMSPEQVRGGSLDRRTDIFSFGCILYESVTGRPAFDGKSALDRIEATLNDEPDWALLPAKTPDSIRSLIGHCLEKTLVHRLRDIADARWNIEVALGKRATPVAPKPAAPTPNNLIPTLLKFIGREDAIERLCSALGDCRLLSVVGVGGCGKTSVALMVAQRLLPDRPGGVWFVDLSGTSDPSRVPETISTAIRAAPRDGTPDVGGSQHLQGIADQIRDQSALLILDNCEHLLAGVAPVIDRLLRVCPQLRILTTTREVIGLEAEQVYFMPSLTLPGDAAGDSDEELLQNEAVRLFVERARLVRPDFNPRGANLATVAALCQRLDGIPLAIELAAARIKMLTPEQIAARLDNRFQLLTGGGLDRPPRHRTLAAMLDWSFRLLSEEDRNSLHRLAAFVSGWSLEGAGALLGTGDVITLDLLTRLLDKSLIVAEASSESEALPADVRYRMHETIREYLRLDRIESPDLKKQSELGRLWWESCNAHLEYFAALAKSLCAGLRESPTEALWRVVLKERDNFLSAQRFALEHPNKLERAFTEDLREIWKRVFEPAKPPA